MMGQIYCKDAPRHVSTKKIPQTTYKAIFRSCLKKSSPREVSLKINLSIFKELTVSQQYIMKYCYKNVANVFLLCVWKIFFFKLFA